MTPAELRSELRSALVGALAGAGFLSKGHFVLRRRTAFATDWLAIIAKGYRDGPIDATINVGIHCAPLHRLIAELDGKKYSETIATFVTNIGYLEDSHHFRQWTFGRTEPDTVLLDSVVATVKTVALPFVEQFVDARSVRRGCELYGISEYNLLRIPALEAIAGHSDEAKALLVASTTSVQSRNDAAAEYFRAAAERLAKRLDAGGAG